MDQSINRWGSAYTQPSFPRATAVTNPSISITGVPLVHGDILTVPPFDLIADYEAQHYGDKIVLSFERLPSDEHILDWLRQFNRGNNRFQPQFCRALPNWFFVIQIISLRGDISTQAILANLLQSPVFKLQISLR